MRPKRLPRFAGTPLMNALRSFAACDDQKMVIRRSSSSLLPVEEGDDSLSSSWTNEQRGHAVSPYGDWRVATATYPLSRARNQRYAHISRSTMFLFAINDAGERFSTTRSAWPTGLSLAGARDNGSYPQSIISTLLFAQDSLGILIRPLPSLPHNRG